MTIPREQEKAKHNLEDYPLVAIVVPVHNNKEDTAEFLESLKGVTYPNYKIIIIDDGSTDGTEDMIKEKYPYVILLKGDGNLWWSRATNMGIEKAIGIGADYVLLGDNDSIVDSEWISALVDTAEKNPRAIVTSKVYYYDDPKRVFYAGGETTWVIGELKTISGNDDESYNIQKDVKHSVCSGTLVNTAFFKDIGLMDYKNFPQYLADADFTYRAYKKGYRIIYEPKSMMWHKGSSTVKKDAAFNTTSFLSTFIFLTTNIKSWLNFHTIVKYYLRHCPIYSMPYLLMKYVFKIILQSILHSSFFRRIMGRSRTIRP